MRETAQRLLQQKAPVDTKTKAKWTPLITASHFGSLDCAQLLVNMGADINTTTSKKYTALHHAAEKGHSEIVDFLMQNGADLECSDNKGRSAMAIAEQCGYDKVALRLKPEIKVEKPEIIVEDKKIAKEITPIIEKEVSKTVEVLDQVVESINQTEQSAPTVTSPTETLVKSEPPKEIKPTKITDSGTSAALIDMVSKLSENNNKGFSMLHIVSKYNNKEMAGT